MVAKIQTLLNEEKLNKNDYLLWSAYRASKLPILDKPVSNVALLPMFRENAHTTCMLAHSGQVPLMVADQPLYAIANQVLCCWLET